MATRNNECKVKGHRRSGGKFVATIVAMGGLLALMLAAVFGIRGYESPCGLPSDEMQLKQLGLVFAMYANESRDGSFPPITPYPHIWMFDVQSVYPEYLSDLSLLVNPNLPDAAVLRKQILDLQYQKPADWESITRIAARSYAYVPWAMHDLSELKPLSKARDSLDFKTLDGDITYNGTVYYRLREGVERRSVTKSFVPDSTSRAHSGIPVLFDVTCDAGTTSGGWCLYWDGHVGFNEGYAGLESLLK